MGDTKQKMKMKPINLNLVIIMDLQLLVYGKVWKAK